MMNHLLEHLLRSRSIYENEEYMVFLTSHGLRFPVSYKSLRSRFPIRYPLLILLYFRLVFLSVDRNEIYYSDSVNVSFFDGRHNTIDPVT